METGLEVLVGLMQCTMVLKIKWGHCCPRKDNRERNMRLSFHPSPGNENVAHWIVYHARGQGIKEEVVLEKYPSDI